MNLSGNKFAGIIQGYFLLLAAHHDKNFEKKFKSLYPITRTWNVVQFTEIFLNKDKQNLCLR